MINEQVNSSIMTKKLYVLLTQALNIRDTIDNLIKENTNNR